MTEVERGVILRMSWLRPAMRFAGKELRPLSLPSRAAVVAMGLSVLDREITLTPAQEIAEVQAYVWLHSVTVTVEEAMAAIWDGSWRDLLHYEEVSDVATVAVLEQWRAYRKPMLALIEATEMEVIARKRKASTTPEAIPPSDLLNPTVSSHEMVTVMRVLGMSDPLELWTLPVWEAYQIYHVERRGEGGWTVPRRERTPEDEMEKFAIPALAEESSDEAAAPL